MWRLDRFNDKEIVIRYKKALSIEEPNFIKEIRSIEESDIRYTYVNSRST